jgi:hypothetical protein
MTAEDYGLARRMWHQLEPVHAVFWYAPEVFAEAAALGMTSRPGSRATSRGGWLRWAQWARGWPPQPATASARTWWAPTCLPRGQWPRRRRSWPRASGRSTGCTGRCWAT